MSTAEVARMLHVSPQTVRRWADAGVLRSYRLTPNSPRRFYHDDVKLLIERAMAGGA